MRLPKTELLQRERFVLLVFAIFIFLVALFTFVFENQQEALPQTILVKVVGDVEESGVIEVAKGCSVRDLLEQVRPLAGAKVKRLRPESSLRQGQVIEILIPKVRVEFSGALTRPVTLQVNKGITVDEILFQLPLHPDADLDAVRGRILSRSGQKIKIPVRG